MEASLQPRVGADYSLGGWRWGGFMPSQAASTTRVRPKAWRPASTFSILDW